MAIAFTIAYVIRGSIVNGILVAILLAYIAPLALAIQAFEEAPYEVETIVFFSVLAAQTRPWHGG